eukprot:9506182-Alexandrium_andersonii.AAC.1
MRRLASAAAVHGLLDVRAVGEDAGGLQVEALGGALAEGALVQAAAPPRVLEEARGQRGPGARVPGVLEVREAAQLVLLQHAGRR